MTKFIYGTFESLSKAEEAVQELKERGVPIADISIATNKAHIEETTSITGVEIYQTEVNHEENTWWDNLVGFFNPSTTTHNPEVTGIPTVNGLPPVGGLNPDVAPTLDYDNYRQTFEEGHVLVLVEEVHLNPGDHEGGPTV